MRRRHGERSRRGAAAIEYALLLPVLLLIVLGIIDAGRLLWVYTTLNRAAAAAARCAVVNASECSSEPQIKSRVVAEAWGLGISPAAVAVTTAACGVQVSANYDFAFIIPGLGAISPLGTITLRATACYPQ